MNIPRKYILIAIILLGLSLRLFHLSSNPPHLTPDEAALGYNAYSILKTGKDEYGTPFPLVFKSFGDYKPGLYVYLTVPFISIMGLNEFAVRFPSAFMGVLAVYFMYQFVKLLSKDETLALIAAFLLAVSPWHMHFSRGAWEANVALTFLLVALTFFVRAMQKARWLPVASVFCAFSLLSYQGSKLSVVLALLIFSLFFLKELKNIPIKTYGVSLLLGFFVSLPIIVSLFAGQTGRLGVFSVFSYPRPPEYLTAFLNNGGDHVGSVTYYMFHSEPLNFLRGILGRWFNHYSARFLLFEGDWSNPRHSVPHSGVITLIDGLFLVVGIYVVMSKSTRRWMMPIIAWFILSPLPSVLSRDQVHAVRSLPMVIPLTVLIALGLRSVAVLPMRKITISFVGILYIASYAYFLDAYFIHGVVHNSHYWAYGYKQIMEEIKPYAQEGKTIYIQQSYEQPYIFYLFYTQYNPALYQQQANLVESTSGDVGYVEHIDTVHFVQIDWSAQRGTHGAIFAADPIKIPPQDSSSPAEFTLLKEILYLNNKDTAFRIIEIK